MRADARHLFDYSGVLAHGHGQCDKGVITFNEHEREKYGILTS